MGLRRCETTGCFARAGLQHLEAVVQTYQQFVSPRAKRAPLHASAALLAMLTVSHERAYPPCIFNTSRPLHRTQQSGHLAKKFRSPPPGGCRVVFIKEGLHCTGPEFEFRWFLVAWSNGAVPEPLFNTALKAAAQSEAFEASSPVPTMRIHALPPKAPTVHASTNADHAQTLMP